MANRQNTAGLDWPRGQWATRQTLSVVQGSGGGNTPDIPPPSLRHPASSPFFCPAATSGGGFCFSCSCLPLSRRQQRHDPPCSPSRLNPPECVGRRSLALVMIETPPSAISRCTRLVNANHKPILPQRAVQAAFIGADLGNCYD